jgi:pimeloyl-ACP methyl ester carboxylesterase
MDRGAAQSAESPAPGLVLKQAELRDGDRSVEAEYGHLAVPMRHDDPDARKIELAVVVRRSTAAEPGAPILFLNGIPGAATNLAVEEYWDDYLALGDVVLFDQRGSGRSSP